jgi:hypothetical protein
VILAVPDAAIDPAATVIELNLRRAANCLRPADFLKAELQPIDITFSDFAADDSYRIYALDGKDPNTSSLYYEGTVYTTKRHDHRCKITTDGKVLSPSAENLYQKITLLETQLSSGCYPTLFKRDAYNSYF